jgi:NAD(P)-dependent dehydrogenase (short-subunit alcohol dehydrogenase family)
VTTAYVCLALYASSWLNNRLRNGLLPLARLNAKTWPQELVFVTGGAAGIGKLTAERLAHKGAKVAAVDVVDFKPEHANIKTYKCDISDIEALQAVREQIVKDFGLQVTMVANIAGACPVKEAQPRRRLSRAAAAQASTIKNSSST